MQAYIYARFSTLEQAKGSSLARQLADCRSFCDRRGWERSLEREMIDEGRSAFDGANRANGSCLASFERDVLAGLLPANTVLVVERLDRLSRQSPFDVFDLLSGLTRCGLTIATVDGERVYERGSFNFPSLVEIIVKAQVSHEESEKKSQRLSAAWAYKRAGAVAGVNRVFTRRCPQRMGVDERRQCYVLQPERAEVTRRIFQMATSGQGKHLIARTLNREGVSTWGGGDGWHASYVQKILVSRATVGEMQPHKKVGGKRVVEGEPIQNYYPAVIDEAIFAQAQADRASRAGMVGRRGKRISNLFARLAKCGSCGSTMTFRNKGRVGEQYLVCDAALRGRSCSFTLHFHYPALERTIVDQTLHLALGDRHLSGSDHVKQLEAEVAQQRRALLELDQRQGRLVDLLSRVENDEVERKLIQISADLTSKKADVVDAERRLMYARGAVTPKENITRIRNLLSAMNSDDEYESTAARGTVQQALRSLIHSITCDPRTENVLVNVGTRTFTLDRFGRLPPGPTEIGLVSLMDLREKGWVVTRYRDHAALGKRAPPARD